MIVATVEYKGFKFDIWQDCEETFNPRQYDNVGHMICFHRDYVLGDKHDFTSDAIQVFINKPGVFSLPLYFYDHSLQDIATEIKPYWHHAAWDSGQVGIIYATVEDANRIGINIEGMCDEEIENRIFDSLEFEVQEYAKYVRGEVYGFTILSGIGESCGGFLGGDFEESGLFDEVHSSIDWYIKERTKKHVEKLKGQIKNHVGLEYREPFSIGGEG